MRFIISFLRLIRSVNLFYIALTQYLVQYTIIKPILSQAGFQPTLDDLHFALLVASTVLVAAAGYVINDYFDLKIDEVNKPKRIFIDRIIRRRTAILAHWLMTGAGILLGFYVAWHAHNLKLGFIQPIVAAFLWFYSTGYKRRAVIGNLIVSFLSALVVLIVGLYERQLFYPSDPSIFDAARTIFIVLFGYFLFAFLISMIRELVKDMEDLEGDKMYGCRTLPIVIGTQKTKWLVLAIAAMMIGLLVYIQVLQVKGGDFLSAMNIFTTIELPLTIAMLLMHRAEAQKQFTLVSNIIKFVMLMGILTMVYFYYLH